MGGTMVGKSILVATSTTMPTTVSDIPTVSPDRGATHNAWLIIPPGATGGFSGGINDSYGI